MPVTRRQSGGSAASKSKAKPKASQTKLAFHGSNKVTKGVPASPAGKKEASLDDDDDDPKPTTLAPETVEVEEPESAESSLAEITLPDVQPPSAQEQRALKVKDSQIKKYWAEKEKARMAPRVHQEGLSLHEKLLREWDTDGRYGPCGGSTRTKRWNRAHMLGLDPPIEVLAALLKERAADNKKVEKTHIDELMSSRTAEL